MMYMSPTIHERDNEFGILTVVSSLSPECDLEFEILNIVFEFGVASVILLLLKTMELLQNGCNPNPGATPLFSIRAVSLVSSESCCSVDGRGSVLTDP